MTTGTRIVLALVLLGGAAAGFAALTWEPPREHGDLRGNTGFRQFTSSNDCRECHAAVFEEWEGSHHQIAYTNPEVRKLSDDFRNKECQACHLPRPVLDTGIGKRPLQRQTRPKEGVDCFSCHMQNKRIVGTRDIPSAPCKPIKGDGLTTTALCKSCHNQHGTSEQYLASEYPKKGVSCRSCHMPEVGRAEGRKGFAHVFPGGHDQAFLRTACTFDAKRSGASVEVTVVNVGAGHNFPTEERHRAADVLYRFVAKGDAGTGDWTRLHRFREPDRGEPGPNTQLPAGQTWTGRIAVADAKQPILEVRLVYKLQPFMSDADAVLLYEKRIEL